MVENSGIAGKRTLSEYESQDIVHDNHGAFNLDGIHNVDDIVNDEKNLLNLAAEIVADLDLGEALIPDIIALIKVQAHSGDHTDIESFLSNIISTLQDIAGADEQVSENELDQGIVEEGRQFIKNADANSFSDESELRSFLSDVLISIADESGVLKIDDAELLAEFLGIDENLAVNMITATHGNIDQILDLIASSEEMKNSNLEDATHLTLNDITTLEENLETSMLSFAIDDLASEGGINLDNKNNRNNLMTIAQGFLGEHNVPLDDIDLLLNIAGNFEGDGNSLSPEEGHYFMALMMGLKEDLDNNVNDVTDYLAKLHYNSLHGAGSWTSINDQQRTQFKNSTNTHATNPENYANIIKAQIKPQLDAAKSWSSAVQDMAQSTQDIVNNVNQTYSPNNPAPS
ncbi:MAG: hypothetical protein ACJARD_000655 [Alphaproteobacteria bacterium]|jgi:hypothetical protein